MRRQQQGLWLQDLGWNSGLRVWGSALLNRPGKGLQGLGLRISGLQQFKAWAEAALTPKSLRTKPKPLRMSGSRHHLIRRLSERHGLHFRAGMMRGMVSPLSFPALQMAVLLLASEPTCCTASNIFCQHGPRLGAGLGFPECVCRFRSVWKMLKRSHARCEMEDTGRSTHVCCVILQHP